MIDLEERLHALADAVDVPTVSPYDDLTRGRRRRRRHQWTATGAVALTTVTVLMAVWGAVGGASSERVGPAERTVPSQVLEDLREELDGRQLELAAMQADRKAYNALAKWLGLRPVDTYRLDLIPSYDDEDRIEMLAPSVVVRDDATGELREVSARIARSWEATEWRDFSCYPDCETYLLDGRPVEVGRYADQWGWAQERPDGIVVVLLLPAPSETLGIKQGQINNFFLHAELPEVVDEAAAWHDRMLDIGMYAFNDSRYSIITGDASTHTGPAVEAQVEFRGTVVGEARWEAELLTTAPTGCPAGFECQDVFINETTLTLRYITGGELDGWAWISYDGERVQSRILLEPDGDEWPLPLERVATMLTHPTWQTMPESQSVTTG